MKNDVRPNLVEEYMNLLLSRIETAEINEHEWWRKLELILGDSVDSQRQGAHWEIYQYPPLSKINKYHINTDYFLQIAP